MVEVTKFLEDASLNNMNISFTVWFDDFAKYGGGKFAAFSGHSKYKKSSQLQGASPLPP